MKCPHCEVPLMMAERKGVEIDFCGQCRGVWLDKGELDKIIDLTVAERAAARPGVAPREPQSQAFEQRRHNYRRYQDTHGYKKPYYKKKKSSILDEIFDIF